MHPHQDAKLLYLHGDSLGHCSQTGHELFLAASEQVFRWWCLHNTPDGQSTSLCFDSPTQDLPSINQDCYVHIDFESKARRMPGGICDDSLGSGQG